MFNCGILTFLWPFTLTNSQNYHQGHALGVLSGTFNPAGSTLMALHRPTTEVAVTGAAERGELLGSKKLSIKEKYKLKKKIKIKEGRRGGGQQHKSRQRVCVTRNKFTHCIFINALSGGRQQCYVRWGSSVLAVSNGA